MSCLPEAKLAREAEIAYQMICTSTDYDCWHSTAEDVTVEVVMEHMKANAVNARRFISWIHWPRTLMRNWFMPGIWKAASNSA